MNIALKLTVDQVSTAVLLLNEEEKEKLAQRIPVLLKSRAKAQADYDWLSLAESAFSFWEDPEEDLYDDLIFKAKKEMSDDHAN